MKNNHNYNVEVLMDAARDFCDLESDYCVFSKRYSAAKLSGEYYNRREDWERNYDHKYDAANSAWSALVNMCKLVSADVQRVLACYKSIRRNTQYCRNWETEPHMYHSWSFYGEDYEAGSYESFCRFCAES